MPAAHHPVMYRVGSAPDNAVIESWHSTLEIELRALEQQFATKARAWRWVAGWIEEYNHHRRRSALGMCSPIDFELASRLHIRHMSRRHETPAPAHRACPCPPRVHQRRAGTRRTRKRDRCLDVVVEVVHAHVVARVRFHKTDRYGRPCRIQPEARPDERVTRSGRGPAPRQGQVCGRQRCRPMPRLRSLHCPKRCTYRRGRRRVPSHLHSRYRRAVPQATRCAAVTSSSLTSIRRGKCSTAASNASLSTRVRPRLSTAGPDTAISTSRPAPSAAPNLDLSRCVG